MNILLLGSGGREHALAWKLAQSRLLKSGGQIHAAPGNPGIARYAKIALLDIGNHGEVVAFCAEHEIGLVVIGPEAPLVDGLADSLREAGVPVFGPSRAAAQLEGSKSFTKELCQRADIPTAAYVRATSLEAALEALDSFSPPFVLKADGLAAGKGVVIAENRNEAHDALTDMFDGRFGAAGAEVVIEEFMTGEEVSFFAITDGTTIMPFGSAQDHKRVGEGDTGPNTGGMGAYSPAPVLTPELERETIDRILVPTVATMAAEGMPYSGVLYAGLMLTSEGPKLVEYNCRFGDPECQVLMMRLESDLGEYLLACAESRLAEMPPVQFSDDSALTVVLAAKGYPETPKTGGAINGIEAAEEEGAKVFHAGTRMGTKLGIKASDEAGGGASIVASGGRVLNVTGRGADIAKAQQAAYAAVDKIDFPQGFCRRDIGWREVERAAQK